MKVLKLCAIVAPVAALLALLPSAVHADDLYVAQEGQVPVSPYASWDNAASNIQDAVEATGWAGNTYTIWIRPGIYRKRPTDTDTYYGNNTNVVYMGDKSISLRAVSTNAADTVIDGEGKYRGIAKLGGYWTFTPGVEVIYENLTISNCLGRGGESTAGGSALRVALADYGWTNVVRNCVFVDNISLEDDSPYAVVYYGTSSDRKNGVIVSNSVVRDNSAGIYMRSGNAGFMHLASTLVQNNDGSGIDRREGGSLIESCQIIGNKTVDKDYGGAIVFWYGNDKHTIRNSLIANNSFTVRSFGGAAVAACWDVSPRIENCTIVNNSATGGSYNRSGGLYAHRPGTTNIVVNSIIYSNFFDSAHVNHVGNNQGKNLFSSSCTHPISGFAPEDNNINANPFFEDIQGGNFRLKGTSPCINKGEPLDWLTDARDLDGNPRIDKVSGVVDMGAYEYVIGGSLLMIK